MTDELTYDIELGDVPKPIVAMCECNGRMYVATQSRVYELFEGVWRPMVFVIQNETSRAQLHEKQFEAALRDEENI